MIGFFIAAVSGALMSIQGVFNTEVTKTTGPWVSNLWVQSTAALCALFVWFVIGHEQLTTIGRVEPKYLLFGGVLGVGITATVMKSIHQLGPAKAALTIVIAQVLISYIIEVFGLFGMEQKPFEWIKILGIGLAIVGLTIAK